MREHRLRTFFDSIKLTLKKSSQIVFAFSILAAFGYGLYSIAALIWRSLIQVNSTLAVGVVAAVSTIAVSITSLIVSKYFERKSEIRNEHRQRKTPIYEELIAFLFKILKSVKTNEPMPTEKRWLTLCLTLTKS